MSIRFLVVHLQSKIKAVLQIIFFDIKDNIIQHCWSLKDTEIEIKHHLFAGILWVFRWRAFA